MEDNDYNGWLEAQKELVRAELAETARKERKEALKQVTFLVLGVTAALAVAALMMWFA